MMRLRDTPIRQKVTLVIMLVTVSSLLASFTLLFFVEAERIRRSLQQELQSIAGIVGGTSKAALEFEDQQAAKQLLTVLGEDQRILRAVLYNARGEEFAVFEAEAAKEGGASREGGVEALLASSTLHIEEPIVLQGRQIGRVAIHAATTGFLDRLGDYLVVSITVLVVSSGLALLLSARLRDLLVLPLLHLAETARLVSTKADYSLRATKETNDETGVLVDQFNQMLEEISRQNRALKEREDELRGLNEALEQRVQERTKALQESQEQLRHSERLASIGILAEGLAHEIRNPLNSILLATQYALKNPKNLDPKLAKVLNTVSSEAKRCAWIIRNVLLFARSEPTKKGPSDLNEVVRHAASVALEYAQTPRVKIDLKLKEGLPPLNLNRSEVEQVVVNLINNATEAARGEVAIEIATEEENDKVRLKVKDNGPGMEEEVMKHVFDPFFSTKRHQGKTGLGLSLSHGIVSDHGGTMHVTSAVGEGATFTIEFPR